MAHDFTLAGYASVLERARAAGYSLVPMKEALVPKRSPIMILRHDVDFALEYAEEMAALESRVGVRSTYFVLLHGDFYSPLSPGGRKSLQRILANGHEIGLHWDSSDYPRARSGARECLRHDVETLARAIGAPVVSASQHLPADAPRNGKPLAVSDWVAYEAYSGPIWERFRYVSDSSMRWRTKRPSDLIDQRADIQFLAHPIWWCADGLTAMEKLRTVPTLAKRRMDKLCHEFADYMMAAIEDRVRGDDAFRRARAGFRKDGRGGAAGGSRRVHDRDPGVGT
jgi:hypothetical protein